MALLNIRHGATRCPGPGLRAALAAPIGLCLLFGCRRDGAESALRPAGPGAASIETLWWFMFWVCGAVFAIVILLTLGALVRGRRSGGAAPLGEAFIVASGIILPAVVLIAMLIYSLRTSMALATPPDTAFTVRIIGHQWWWEVHYPDHGITTANEIHIPVGQPVRLELTSADVIHSFWVPRLQGKMDLIPGHTNTFWIEANEAGVYHGPCAEYCGTQHALMMLSVIALPAEQFAQWAAARQIPPPQPQDEQLRRGQRAFFAAACHNCHAIAGTEATGRIGPDLSDLASRRTLGAGALPNTRGGLAGWIANPQPLKPGNKMPPTYLPPEDFHALLAYLETLK